MKRQNTDLLLKSLRALFDISKRQDDGHPHLQALGDFVWHLSVARRDELDEVYNLVIEDEGFWKLSVDVHSIFGRVYAASLASSDQAKALEVSKRLLRPYCDPVEWEDVKNGLNLQTDDTK